ncbi:hypothetical protein LSAT2_013194 [Lamellibrachia satsuma]|nr:hypothetical protein LSAT2_013194 [Lamellibrachia satsuma]
MSVITNVPEPNLWNEICKEFETKRSPPDDKDKAVDAELVNYDASSHHPVFFGLMHKKVTVDVDVLKDFDVSPGTSCKRWLCLCV